MLSYGRLSNGRADSRAVQSQTLQVLTKPVAAFHAAVVSVASSVRVGRQQVLKDRRALTRTVAVNAAWFCVQANHQAREESQAWFSSIRDSTSAI